MKADQVKRLNERERANRKLKAMVADQTLKSRALEAIANENW